MTVKGKRTRRTRLIQEGRYVVALEVEMVFPADDPTEPCYEAETVELVREVQARAKQGDVKWLRKVGKVFEPVES